MVVLSRRRSLKVECFVVVVVFGLVGCLRGVCLCRAFDGFLIRVRSCCLAFSVRRAYVLSGFCL